MAKSDGYLFTFDMTSRWSSWAAEQVPSASFKLNAFACLDKLSQCHRLNQFLTGFQMKHNNLHAKTKFVDCTVNFVE